MGRKPLVLAKFWPTSANFSKFWPILNHLKLIFEGGVTEGRGIPHRHERYKVCPQCCCDIWTITRARHSGKKKRTQMLACWARRLLWGGGLPCEGVGVEKFVPSFKTLFFLASEGGNMGCPRHFAGMSRTPAGVRKECRKKFVLISF